MSNIAIGAEYVGTLAFGYLAIVYLMGQAPKVGSHAYPIYQIRKGSLRGPMSVFSVLDFYWIMGLIDLPYLFASYRECFN
jgi:hypothetical protein